MSKTNSELASAANDDMRPEYDLQGAVRGKHYKPLHKGYTVHVHQSDGTTEVQHFTLAEGTVMLDPDVREVFPDSEAVNAALRSLIVLMSELPGAARSAQRKHAVADKRTAYESKPLRDS